MQNEHKTNTAFVRLERLLAPRASGDRDCGPCTACCTVMAVPELAKPARRACDHVSLMGCSVHNDRPESCRAFNCLWLRGAIEGEESTRPDQIGVCFDAFNSIETGSVMLYAFELWEGALETTEAQKLIEALSHTHDVHLSYRDRTWRTVSAGESESG